MLGIYVYENFLFFTLTCVRQVGIPGSYIVQILFAETWHSAGQRKMDVAINGAVVLANFDIADESGL